MNYDIHLEPVNSQARKILMKSPWWAHAPEHTKALMESKKLDPLQFIQLTKPPPDTRPNQIDDKRGQRFGRWLVIGYADCSESKRVRTSKNPKPSWYIGLWDSRDRIVTEINRNHFWWVTCDCGETQRLDNTRLYKAAKLGNICWTCHPELRHADSGLAAQIKIHSTQCK